MTVAVNRKMTQQKPSDHWYRKIACAALAAGAGVVASPQDAQAQIVVYTPNISTTGTTGASNIFFDFLSGTTSTNTFVGAQFQLQRSDVFGPNVAFFYALNLNNHVIGSQGGFGYFYPHKLALNNAVAPAGPWNTAAGVGFQTLGGNGGFPYGNWAVPGAAAYLGLRFGDGTNFNYGWAEVSLDADANVTLSRFGYNTVLNQPIAAGAVPEPSSAALLALGAAGLAAYRKRRNRKDEASATTATVA